jgi:CheY-like chemotaxis protein
VKCNYMVPEKTSYISIEDHEAAKMLANQGEEAIKKAEESGDNAQEIRAQLARKFFLRDKSQIFNNQECSAVRFQYASANNDTTDTVQTPEIIKGEGNVIVVEDDAALRKLANRMISKYGYRVEGFAGADEVLRFFDKGSESKSFTPEEVDLIICDVLLPRTDGLTLIRQLKEKRPDIKVIFTSGSSADDFDFDDTEQPFFQKPFDYKELAKTIKGLIEERTGD